MATSLQQEHESGMTKALDTLTSSSCALWLAAITQNDINASLEHTQELKCYATPWRTLEEQEPFTFSTVLIAKTACFSQMWLFFPAVLYGWVWYQYNFRVALL